MKNRSEFAIPLDIYVSYSHNPLGESYKIIQNEKSTGDRNQNRFVYIYYVPTYVWVLGRCR